MFKNNIGLIVTLLLIIIIGNEVYTQITKVPHSAKSSRLICHKETVTFEKVLKPKLIVNLHKSIQSNNYKLIVWADKAKYMKSVMFNYVDINSIKKNMALQFKSYEKNIQQTSDDVIIDVMIYENDKKNPGKKTKRSKLYAGYIEVSISVNKRYVYKIQTDFMDLKGNDIPKRISCIVKSIMTLGEKNE